MLAALHHERAHGEPERVVDGELVVHDVAEEGQSPPLVRTEPANQEHADADDHVHDGDAHPHGHGERLHEGEHPGLHLLGALDHDADADVHERFGEVHHPLPLRCDSQRGHRQIRGLKNKTNKIMNLLDIKLF